VGYWLQHPSSAFPTEGRDFTLFQEYESALGASRFPTPSVSRELSAVIKRPKREENDIVVSNVRFRTLKRKAIPLQTWTGPEGCRR